MNIQYPNDSKRKNQVVTRRPNGTFRVVSMPDGESRTDPSQAEDTDADVIINRMKKGIFTDHMKRAPGTYSDLTKLPDIHTAMNTIAQATSAFDALPATLRKRFSNDPRELVAFLQDESNRDEAIKLGLINPPPKKTVQEPQVSDGDKRQRVQSSKKPIPTTSHSIQNNDDDDSND